MSIIRKSGESVETLFEGRVLKVFRYTGTRNWSGTMDYTDRHPTECVDALVYLGTSWDLGYTEYVPEVLRPYSKPRDLAPHERFGWVDCTNMSARIGMSDIWLTAEVDVVWTEEMKADYAAYEAHREAKKAEDERKAQEARELEARKEAEKAAKRAAREAASEKQRKVAEEALNGLPPKGTKVTVQGVEGILAWSGVTKFRNKWQTRVGVRDAKGTMHWFNASEIPGFVAKPPAFWERL